MKVILIGKATGWEDAPMEGETWGVNDLLLRRPVKLAFQIHDIPTVFKRNPKEINEINRLGIPVITSMEHELLPNAVVFPLDKMPSKYFNNSIAIMIAYAIYKGATEIEMYGVALLVEREYAYQRPCVEFWIGYALAKGIKVTVHGETSIECFKPQYPPYGTIGR